MNKSINICLSVLTYQYGNNAKLWDRMYKCSGLGFAWRICPGLPCYSEFASGLWRTVTSLLFGHLCNWDVRRSFATYPPFYGYVAVISVHIHYTFYQSSRVLQFHLEVSFQVVLAFSMILKYFLPYISIDVTISLSTTHLETCICGYIDVLRPLLHQYYVAHCPLPEIFKWLVAIILTDFYLLSQNWIALTFNFIGKTKWPNYYYYKLWFVLKFLLTHSLTHIYVAVQLFVALRAMDVFSCPPSDKLPPAVINPIWFDVVEVCLSDDSSLWLCKS